MRKTRRHVHFFRLFYSLSLSLSLSLSCRRRRSSSSRSFFFSISRARVLLCWFVIELPSTENWFRVSVSRRKIYRFFLFVGGLFFSKRLPHFYIQLSLSVSSFVCLSVRPSVCLSVLLHSRRTGKRRIVRANKRWACF